MINLILSFVVLHSIIGFALFNLWAYIDKEMVKESNIFHIILYGPIFWTLFLIVAVYVYFEEKRDNR